MVLKKWVASYLTEVLQNYIYSISHIKIPGLDIKIPKLFLSEVTSEKAGIAKEIMEELSKIVDNNNEGSVKTLAGIALHDNENSLKEKRERFNGLPTKLEPVISSCIDCFECEIPKVQKYAPLFILEPEFHTLSLNEFESIFFKTEIALQYYVSLLIKQYFIVTVELTKQTFVKKSQNLVLVGDESLKHLQDFIFGKLTCINTNGNYTKDQILDFLSGILEGISASSYKNAPCVCRFREEVEIVRNTIINGKTKKEVDEIDLKHKLESPVLTGKNQKSKEDTLKDLLDLPSTSALLEMNEKSNSSLNLAALHSLNASIEAFKENEENAVLSPPITAIAFVAPTAAAEQSAVVAQTTAAIQSATAASHGTSIALHTAAAITSPEDLDSSQESLKSKLLLTTSQSSVKLPSDFSLTSSHATLSASYSSITNK